MPPVDIRLSPEITPYNDLDMEKQDLFESILNKFNIQRMPFYGVPRYQVMISHIRPEDATEIVEALLKGPDNKELKLIMFLDNPNNRIGTLLINKETGLFQFASMSNIEKEYDNKADAIAEFMSIINIWLEHIRVKEEERARVIREESQRRLRKEKELAEQERIRKERKTTCPEEYYGLYLQNYPYGEDVLIRPTVETILDRNGIMLIVFDLPAKDKVSKVKEIRYLARSGERKELYLTDKQFEKRYEDTLYRICLRSIQAVYVEDEDCLINSIAFNGYVTDYSKTTGLMERRLILSILTDREGFTELDIDHVDPKSCFKAIKGVSATKLYDLSPVMPVLELDKNDSRFVKSHSIAISSGTNLAEMDWEEFEQLVREVFEKHFSALGGEVKITQASRDGGVDAVAFDPDPFTGGKIIIQAKRYTNTVPVSAVRDLYGAIINEGANKGILVTTSDYGPDSYEFSKGKPITLMNGGHLLGLLQKNGMEGYIDLAEAKRSLGFS